MNLLVRYGIMAGYSIPDGSTAEPIDDYAIWLRCAGISPNGYADLAAVIADSDAKTILCDNLNALRYMVRSDSTIMSAVLASSDWIAALDGSTYAVHTPTMTSNTAPSGTAFASSVVDANYAAWYAFDKTSYDAASTKSWVSSGNVPQNIGYHFTTAPYVYRCKIRTAGYASWVPFIPSAFKLQGSNDGSAYDDLATLTNSNFNAATITYYNATAFGSYEYYRLLISAVNSGTNVAVDEVEFYGLNLA